MESEKQSALIILLVMASLTTSSAMDILWRNYVMNPSPDTTDYPAKNFLDVPFNSFMDNAKDVHTTEITNGKIPVSPDHTVMSFDEPNDEIAPPTNDHTTEDTTVKVPVPSDHTVIPFSDPKDEIVPPADVHTTEDTSINIPVPSNHAVISFSDTTDEIAPPADNSFVNPTNNTMNLVRLNFMMDDLMDDTVDEPMHDSLEESTVIFIRPKPNIFSVQVREFHECVSCSNNDEPRKHFDQCLQKLSFKNQEIIKSCCNTSFEYDFCSRASTGKIDYATICEHPEKALKAGDCFWQKIEDKDTEDIKEYRECKKEILDRYCTVKSFKEIDPGMEDVQG